MHRRTLAGVPLRPDGTLPPLGGGDPASDRPAPPLMNLGDAAWAIRRDSLDRIAEAWRATSSSTRAAAAEHAAPSPMSIRRRGEDRRSASGVAVVPLTGVLTPRGSVLSFLFGGGFGGLQDFREQFTEAINSPDVGAVVIDVDSPGGQCGLVPETAADIRAGAAQKPVVAVCNTMACSGAYWIASQANELIVTPSGMAGSIGVYILHESWAGWNEQAGIEPTFIQAGQYKTDGNMEEPLSDSAREEFQMQVDDIYASFVADVAAGRGVSTDEVIAGYGEGRTFMSGRAVELGMADRVATLEQIVGELLDGDGPSAQAQTLAERRAALASDTPPPTPPPAPPARSDTDVRDARARRVSVLFG